MIKFFKEIIYIYINYYDNNNIILTKKKKKIKKKFKYNYIFIIKIIPF